MAKKGYKQTEEHKKKLSENSAKYWKNKNRSEKTKKKISKTLKGRKLTEEHKRNLSIVLCGENNPNWIDGRSSDSYYLWVNSTISKHKRKYQVNISRNELIILAKNIKYCTYCNVKMNYNRGKGIQDNSPALDRIDNEKILNMNNVQIICHKCNTTKSNRTHKEFINYCKMIVNKFELKEGYIAKSKLNLEICDDFKFSDSENI